MSGNPHPAGSRFASFWVDLRWRLVQPDSLHSAQQFAQNWYSLMVDFWLACVIGVAFFSERGDTFNDARDLRLRDSANPFPGSDPRFAQPPKH